MYVIILFLCVVPQHLLRELDSPHYSLLLHLDLSFGVISQLFLGDCEIGVRSCSMNTPQVFSLKKHGITMLHEHVNLK